MSNMIWLYVPIKELQMADQRIVIDEYVVQKAAGGVESATREIVSSFLPLVRRIAAEYAKGLNSSSIMDYDDLVQEGAYGLIVALRRFDLGKGRNMVSYFDYAIRLAIRKSLTENARTVRIPKYMLERFRKLEGLRKEYEKHGLPLTEEVLKKELGVSSKQLSRTMDAYRRQVMVSLDEQAEEEGLSFLSRIAVPDFTEDYLLSERLEKLEGRLALLPREDRRLLSSLYGLHGEAKLSRSEIARRLGLKPYEVSRRAGRIERELLEAM